MEYDRTKMNFFQSQEEVWIVQQTQDGQSAHDFIGIVVAEEGSRQLPGIDPHKPSISTKVTLFRPSLKPVYGGPTLLEALWHEMDAIMERLMTGNTSDDGICSNKDCDSHISAYPYVEERDRDEPCQHPVEGDKYRAQQLAWVLAIVTNAYNPSVDMIRAEAMKRWNEAQA